MGHCTDERGDDLVEPLPTSHQPQDAQDAQHSKHAKEGELDATTRRERCRHHLDDGQNDNRPVEAIPAIGPILDAPGAATESARSPSVAVARSKIGKPLKPR